MKKEKKEKPIREAWEEKSPLGKDHCDKLFDLSARKMHWTNPETSEFELIGENWKAYREGLEDDLQKEMFDMKVIDLCWSILNDPRFIKMCKEAEEKF